MGVAVDVTHALPVGAEELGAALAGGVEAEGVVPGLALGGGEVGEGNVFGADGIRQVVVSVAADGVETHGGRDGIGRGGEAGAGVVGGAAVAGGVGEDGPHPLGAVKAAGVVVEIAAFREGVEEGVELVVGGGDAEGGPAGFEVGGGSGGGGARGRGDGERGEGDEGVAESYEGAETQGRGEDASWVGGK